MNINKFSVPRQRIIVVDVLLVLTTGAMFVVQDIVFLFHLIFILLSIGAFFWNFRAFLLRSIFWVAVTTTMVLQAILSGQTQRTELIEIPMLSTILIIVFLIASRRTRAQQELELKNGELQKALDERNALQEALTHQAFYDPLTGLPNRVLFYDRLHQALSRASRYHGHVAVLFLDLDGFKAVNDRFGHSNGDKLLVLVADRMQMQMRAEDTVARLGGDEFTVLLGHETTVTGAGQVARRLLDDISMPYEIEGEMITLSASIGVAVSSAENMLPDDLVRNADHAMYQAKTNGKATFKIFDVA